MRKEDKTKIEKLLAKNDNEKLIMARFFYTTNKCLLYPLNEIEYNSLETIRYEEVISAEESDFKTVNVLHSRFPNIKRVFVYYNSIDNTYANKDEIENGGWKVINNQEYSINGEKIKIPMYETSCYFIFCVPKSFKMNFDRDVEINGIRMNG